MGVSLKKYADMTREISTYQSITMTEDSMMNLPVMIQIIPCIRLRLTVRNRGLNLPSAAYLKGSN